MSYTILDHLADVEFRTTGPTLEDAFADVVRGMAEIVGDDDETDRSEEAEAIAGDYGTDVITAMEEGRAAGAIVEYAEDHDIDHIVLGSHGPRGLSRFLLGSVAERVARRSPGSMTIIGEEKPERDG